MSTRLAIAATPQEIRAALTGEEPGQFLAEYRKVMVEATGTPDVSGVHAMLERWRRVAWSASDDPAAHAHLLAAAARLNAGEDVPVVPWEQLRTAGHGHGASPQVRLQMTTQSSAPGGHNIIHVGGITAVVVPLDEYQILAALRNRASAAAIEQAETDAATAEQQQPDTDGRPGGTIPIDDQPDQAGLPDAGLPGETEFSPGELSWLRLALNNLENNLPAELETPAVDKALKKLRTMLGNRS